MKDKRELSVDQERRILHAIFFTFGLGIMGWIPRFPEVKENLGLNNAAFGSILTTGAIGAFLGLLTVGHVVHKVGVRKVFITAATIIYGSLTAIVHVQNPLIFVALNIIIGFGITAMHISINAQGFDLQERSEINVIVSSSGYWSAGALTTAILSGFLVGKVGLSLHIGAVSISSLLISLYLLSQLKSHVVTANTHPESDYSIKDIFTSFHLDWPISLGMACIVYLEFAIADWGTIFTKERLEVTAGQSTLPYIFFTIFIIFGRLSAHRLTGEIPLDKLARILSAVAGFGFVIPIIIATHLPESQKNASFILFIIAFSLAGLGSSILAPSFTSAANRRSPHPSAVVVGQFGVTNNVLTTMLKWIVAGVIGATGSIALGLMIPGFLAIIGIFFSRALVEEKR